MNIEVKNMKFVDGKLSMKLVIDDPSIIREFNNLISQIKSSTGKRSGTHYHQCLRRLNTLVTGISVSRPSIEKNLIRNLFKEITGSRQRAHEVIQQMRAFGILIESLNQDSWIVDTEKTTINLKTF